MKFLDIFKMKSETYDKLKYVALVFLPIAASLYGGLAEVWGWPYGTQIQTSISLFNTALGGWLLISTAQYNKTKSST